MKVLFLDIDGVLNTFLWRRQLGIDAYSIIVDRQKMVFLQQIVDHTGAKIVLTSSWRVWWFQGPVQRDPAGAILTTAFSEFGLYIFDKTPFFESENRSDEIAVWLSEHPGVTDYVIIDDTVYDWTPEQKLRWVHPDGHDEGLTAELAEAAIQILNGDLPAPREDPPERIMEQLKKLFAEIFGTGN